MNFDFLMIQWWFLLLLLLDLLFPLQLQLLNPPFGISFISLFLFSLIRSRLSRWTFAVIPLSQLLVSLAILTFSVLRMYRLTQVSSPLYSLFLIPNIPQNRQIANILLDMEKPEDYAHTAEEGTEIIRYIDIPSPLPYSLLFLIGPDWEQLPFLLLAWISQRLSLVFGLFVLDSKRR